MKIHFLLINAVAEALVEIFQKDKYADKVIERLLKSNPKWGSRDRAFIAETTYDCVRWLRLYTHLSNSPQKAFNELTKGDIIEIIGICLVLKLKEDVDFKEFRHLHYPKLRKQVDAITDRKIIYSIPDWIDETCAAELGEDEWALEIQALNQPAEVVLRCNNLKINKTALKQKLTEINFETTDTPLSTEALILKKRGNVFSTEFFKQGFFEVQDAGSQLIAPFLQVKAGMRVIDACAGAGGKSLHLATLMQNKGTLISMDTEGWKLEELKKRAKRNGIHIVETRVIESSKTIKRLHESADRLLLDVPCSGLGVLRRNPDSKWKLQPAFLNEIKATQAKILQDYSKMVKLGGKMVYATCSILSSENEKQVQNFIQNNPHWRFVEDRHLTPAKEGFDGFYMALLERIS